MDDQAFIRLSQQEAQSLYRISMSLLRHQADAQDAVQQGLTKGWAAHEKALPGHEKAWLTKIVIHECRNIQRYRMRVTPAERIEESAWSPPDPVLRDTIDELPEKFRLPLLLKYMEGMSEEEAAQTLGISLSALKSRLFHARKALKKRMEVDFE